MLSSLAYNFFSTCFFGLIIFLLSYYVVNLVSSYFRPPATYPRPAAAACVTGGQRGLINFEVEITCAKQDLHSGSYGGSVPEAMTDLVCLLSQLTDSTELMAITAPGIEKDLEQPTDEQRKLLRNSNFSIDEAQKSHGIRHLIVRDKEAWLLATCWKPSISFHGIEGAFDGPGEKTVIPAKVSSFSPLNTVTNSGNWKVFHPYGTRPASRDHCRLSQ